MQAACKAEQRSRLAAAAARRPGVGGAASGACPMPSNRRPRR
jgi:hypothetical protein